MELVKESIEIDSLIHKLYSIGIDTPDGLKEEASFEEDFDLDQKDYSLDDLKNIIIVNAEDEEFRSGLSNILIDSLSLDELEDIKETISEFLE